MPSIWQARHGCDNPLRMTRSYDLRHISKAVPTVLNPDWPILAYANRTSLGSGLRRC